MDLSRCIKSPYTFSDKSHILLRMRQGGKSETSVLPILSCTPSYSLVLPRTPLYSPRTSLYSPRTPSYFLVLPWYSLVLARTSSYSPVLPYPSSYFLVLPRTPSYVLVLPPYSLRTSSYSLRTPFVLLSYFGSTEVSLFPPWDEGKNMYKFRRKKKRSKVKYRKIFLINLPYKLFI